MIFQFSKRVSVISIRTYILREIHGEGTSIINKIILFLLYNIKVILRHFLGDVAKYYFWLVFGFVDGCVRRIFRKQVFNFRRLNLKRVNAVSFTVYYFISVYFGLYIHRPRVVKYELTNLCIS